MGGSTRRLPACWRNSAKKSPLPSRKKSRMVCGAREGRVRGNGKRHDRWPTRQRPRTHRQHARQVGVAVEVRPKAVGRALVHKLEDVFQQRHVQHVLPAGETVKK